MTPQTLWFDFGYGQLIEWLDAQAKHESDQNLGAMRRDRSLAYAIVRSLGKLPPITKWWPLPGDEVLNAPGQEETTLSAGDYMRAFAAAAGSSQN